MTDRPPCPECGQPMQYADKAAHKYRCRPCGLTRTLSGRSVGKPSKGGRKAAVRRYNERKRPNRAMYHYVVVESAKRSESGLITPESIVACIEAQSRARAVEHFAPGYQAVLYSSLNDREKRTIAPFTPPHWLT